MPTDQLSIDPAKVTEGIVPFREQAAALRRDGAILGVGGSIDSATVATLETRGLGKDNVLALIMPEGDSSPASEADALVVIGQLGIRHRKVDLMPMLSPLGIYKIMPLQ